MDIHKELIISGDEAAFEAFASGIEAYFPTDWVKPQNDRLKEYIVAEYIGSNVPHAKVAIHYNEEERKSGHLKVGNIVPQDKDQLTICEYNAVLDQFYADIVKPYADSHPAIQVEGPTSGVFDPLDYITADALDKLRSFCYMANKTTGSSHPCDENRWFDFIYQTVDDGRTIDPNLLRRFLADEEYWGETGYVSGHSSWSEEKAGELALEYDNYVRFLQHRINGNRCD